MTIVEKSLFLKTDYGKNIYEEKKDYPIELLNPLITMKNI
jgi:hypothetical protein